ncbi:hypothetical protein B7494_g2875 [Chlorociboria aeruginascens]|nr:hypothetical protein B7494_g2875 [Chlorociboria aeruginascens]
MAAPTPLSISIIPALESDITILAEINALSRLREAITAFYFSDWPDLSSMNKFFTARITTYFQDPNASLFKLTDSETNKILGFACLVFSSGVTSKIGADPGGSFAPPKGFDVEFARKVTTLMSEEISSLAVLAQYQGKWLGSQLLKYCIEKADAVRLPTYLSALPRAHGLYKRNGFVDVDHVDLDLRDFGGDLRCYGVLLHVA